MWKKQKSHDKASGPKFGQIIPPNSKDINGSGKHDSFPTMSKGNGLKEAVGWEEQCSEQQEIRVSAITPNFTTCEQIKGAMNWAMAKSLGVTCHIQEGKIIVSVEWLNKWQGSTQFILGMNFSYHCAILLRSSTLD